jgi:hypothetical protein
MTGEIPTPRPAAPELDFEAFQRIYGPIRALSPGEVATLFEGAPFRWWVAGGWSLELGREPRRLHEDIEVAVPRRDVSALRDWLRDYHLWDTHEGALRHLTAESVVPIDHEQLWMRRDAYTPWLVDLMLTPVAGDTWYYKRDQRVTRPLDDVVRLGSDGIPYQRPEITLLFKARRRSVKDEGDFDAVVPMLAPQDRAWLRSAIDLTESSAHAWLERLG